MRQFLIPKLSLLLISTAVACSETTPLTSPSQPQPGLQPDPVMAPAIVPVTTGSSTVNLWPYTGTNLSGTPQDPMNVIFVGAGDPRNVRDALLSLDNNRAVAPFNQSQTGMLLAGVAQGCTWSDAIGSQQTTYTDQSGWTGSVIQLECGSYVPFRFHVRLFKAGDWTVANAHVEVQIPGTEQHEVIGWEAAEAFLSMELARGGLLAAAPGTTDPINEIGTFGAIRFQIYNGLPAPLRLLAGGPLGNVTSDVPIPSNGRATVLTLVDAPDAGSTSESFTLQFGQIIPKPFCATAGELVRVDGPVMLQQEVVVSASGELITRTNIEGELQVRAFDPTTGTLGDVTRAQVRDHYTTHLGNRVNTVLSTRHQRLLPESGAPQALREALRVADPGADRYDRDENCATGQG